MEPSPWDRRGVVSISEVLVHVLRGGLVESIHRGDLAVVDWQGKLLNFVGSPREKISYIRSAAKPIQALPVVDSGAAARFNFTAEELAVMCASHNAEQRHVDVVRSILHKIGLDESALNCGSHWSLNPAVSIEMVRMGKEHTQVHSNCSGKHSGMLALCQFNGWDVSNYTEADHPVQELLLAKMAELAAMATEEIEIGIDGCGVPVYGMSVYNMAWAFARLANPVQLSFEIQNAVKTVTSAMRKHPFMVAGTGRLCTQLMAASKEKVFAKVGAEGVFCVGVPSLGIGIAMKTEDGNDQRSCGPAAIDVLHQLGVLELEELHQLKMVSNPVILNHRKDVVGEVKSVLNLK